MVVVPPLKPVTTPVPAPTLATPGLLLLHAPPAVGSVSNISEPWQTVLLPEIMVGDGLTVTGVVM